jgi:hypothetical protein
MTVEELRQYLARLLHELPLDRYVERRFTVLEDTGGIPVEMDFRFRGMLRGREPKLPDILKHSRVLILAEPGGGKSVVARAATHQFAREGGRLPVFAELKGYHLGQFTFPVCLVVNPPRFDHRCYDSGIWQHLPGSALGGS